MSEYRTVIVEREGGVLTLTLNRPDRLNALNWLLTSELADAVGKAGADDGVKVIVLTGTGRSFSSGADLASPDPNEGPAPKPDRRLKLTPFTGFGRLSATVRHCHKPIIAAINGFCIGAGFSTALACDIRIASENAKFSAMFVRRGLAPDTGITYYLPRLIGTGKALELLLTGDLIDANQAERMGIVNRVVPPDQLMPATMELANKIAKGASLALELAKQAVYHGQTADLETQLGFEAWCQSICHASEDAKEGRKAFLERRDPAFRGE